jgi:PAS domain S-box-containing protein
VRAWLADVTRSTPLNKSRIHDLQLAASEAVANAMEHAESDVDVGVWILSDRVVIEITNTGVFLPRFHNNDERRYRGLGLPLMVSLGDDVHISRDAADRMTVSLTFLFDKEQGEVSQATKIPLSVLRRIEREELKSAAARAHSEVLADLIERVPQPLAVGSLDGGLLLHNAAYAQLLGYSREELAALDRVSDLTPPEWHEIDKQRRAELTLSGTQVCYNKEYLHKDGSRVPVEIVMHLICGETGSPMYCAFITAAFVARDVTAQKQAEEALLSQAEELRASNAELTRFAYVVSHDLQEPLRMVTSYLQLIEQRYGDLLDENGRVFIDYAVDGATRMQQLINGLLTLSRVSTNGQVLQEVDSAVVFAQAMRNLAVAIRENQAMVTTGCLPVVSADAMQLTQLFQNLIANAIKFRTDRIPEIHVDAENENGRWLFRVQDNGIGIDMEYAKRIFGVFQRLHGREQYPGTGIGLAICKKIVERHGGRIWVESEPGQGSSFFFFMPEHRERGDVGLP